LVGELSTAFELGGGPAAAFAAETGRQLRAKAAFAGDTVEIRRLKGLVRRCEERAALAACGLGRERVRFADLAFYERGRYRQFRPDAADAAALVSVLRELRPHQIFATGDRDDPSSITAVCFDLIRRACAELRGEAWFAECRVWLYRGVETAWDAAEIDMAVPFSPRQLAQKTQAIFHHQSQRSQTPVSAGLREPWQQAEQHNRALATVYDALGLANYEAIEAFQRWRPASA
jgi:glucosamine-6-phosphate deaminase